MLIQKFHAALYPGESPAVAATGAKLFSRQGHWDGGSTLHCVAMALALLGRIGGPVWLPYHEEGSYVLPNSHTVWVITEWDSSATTFLLPEDY